MINTIGKHTITPNTHRTLPMAVCLISTSVHQLDEDDNIPLLPRHNLGLLLTTICPGNSDVDDIRGASFELRVGHLGEPSGTIDE